MSDEKGSRCTVAVAGTACGRAKQASEHIKGSGKYLHDYRRAPRRDWTKPKAPLANHSPENQAYYEDSRIPDVVAVQGQPCEAQVVGWCTADSDPRRDIHEIVSRAQAGSLPLAEELGTMVVCRGCHNWITTHPREASERGWRMSRKDLGLDTPAEIGDDTK